jgi:hypothetical protein
MNALMGFVSDAILGTLLGLNVAGETKARMLRAFNKLLWLQNDLINRHYAGPEEPAIPPSHAGKRTPREKVVA